MEAVKNDIPTLRFPEFSGEWNGKRLGDLFGNISSGKSKILKIGNYNFYGSTGIIGFTSNFDYEGEKLLVARVGANAGSLYKVNGKYGVSDNTLIINNSIENSISFLHSILTAFNLNKLIFGSGQPLITGGQLKSLKLRFPPLPEQQKIATFLTAVDSNIEQLTQKKQLLEQYKKGVMQQLFTQKLRFKDKNGNDFPDWEEKKLGELVGLKLRQIEKPQTNYLAIGIRSHCKGTFHKANFDPSKILMDKLFVVKENDLIVNITFAWEGAIAIVKKQDEGGLVSHRFPTYTFKKPMCIHNFFKYVILDKKFRLELSHISPGGAGRNRVMSKKDFLKIQITIPSVPEQTQIANSLSAIDTKIELVNSELEKTQEFKKGLLQQMFV